MMVINYRKTTNHCVTLKSRTLTSNVGTFRVAIHSISRILCFFKKIICQTPPKSSTWWPSCQATTAALPATFPFRWGIFIGTSDRNCCSCYQSLSKINLLKSATKAKKKKKTKAIKFSLLEFVLNFDCLKHSTRLFCGYIDKKDCPGKWMREKRV